MRTKTQVENELKHTRKLYNRAVKKKANDYVLLGYREKRDTLAWVLGLDQKF